MYLVCINEGKGLVLFLGTQPDTEYQGRISVYTDSTATQGRWRNLVDGQLFDESGPRSRRWRRWSDDLSEILGSQLVFLHIPGNENVGRIVFVTLTYCSISPRPNSPSDFWQHRLSSQNIYFSMERLVRD
jgi:hypothetical protein